MATNVQLIATVVGSLFLPEIIPAAVGSDPYFLKFHVQTCVCLHDTLRNNTCYFVDSSAVEFHFVTKTTDIFFPNLLCSNSPEPA